MYEINLKSQVTIGSEDPPCLTRLLQLKDQQADDKNITSTTGGLLLPRANLVDINTLEPFVNTTDEKYNEHKKHSTGLVYNVGAENNIDAGVYYWDGEKWVNISPREKVDQPDPGIDDPEVLPFANSFIIKPGGYQSIPVMKGFAVWYQEMGKQKTN